MADNDIGIRVTGDISDITSALSDLVSQLSEITDKVVSLVVETDTSSLAEVTSASESASNSLEGVSNEAQNVDQSVTNAGKSGKDMGNKIEEASNGATEAMNVLANSAAALGTYMALEKWASAAGEYEDSWERMSVSLGGTAGSVDGVKDAWSGAIEEMSSATGRGAGSIREFITQMSIAGVDSQEVITSAFEGIAGAAYVTGADINQMTYALQRATRTGILNQRTLTQLGLSTDDIMNATGKSIEQVSEEFKNMDSTQRAAFLGTVYNAKYGTRANDAFKQSWAGVSEALSRAKGWLEIVLGKLILPVLVPAMEAATSAIKGVANGIDSMNPLLKGGLGVVLLLGGGFITLVTSLGAAISAYKMLNIAQSLSIIKGIAENAVKDLTILKNNALLISENALVYAKAAYNAILNSTIIAEAKDAIVKGLSVAKTVLVTAATTAAAAAQWLWNAALAANPIGIVIVAVAALAAGLYLLYQNNEQVRDSINGLWDSIEGLGAYIQQGFMSALTGMITPFQQLYQNIVNFGGDLYNAGREWINNLVDGMWDAIPNIEDALQEVADYFPHSPAKTGPLSQVTPANMSKYGAELGTNLGKSTAESAKQELSKVEGTGFSGLLSDMGRVIATDPKALIGGPGAVIALAVQGRKEIINTAKTNYEATKQMQQQNQQLANMTVEDAQKAGISLNDWATGYRLLGDGAKLTYESLYNRGRTASQIQQEALEALRQKAIEVYDSIKQEAQNAYSSVTSMLSDWGISVPNVKVPMNLVGANVAETIQKLYKQRNKVWSTPGMSIVEKTTEYYRINEQIKNLETYGLNAGSAWSSGVADGITSNTGKISSAAGKATLSLKGRSPPIVGPLKEIDKWGENIASAFIGGMEGGLSDINIPTPTVITKGLGGGNGTTNINVNLEEVNIGGEADANKVGVRIAEGLSKKLLGQASTAGVSITNITRG